MLKKIISIYILSIMLTSCGFKKIGQQKSLIYLQNISVIGDSRIGYTLKNNLQLISNKNANNKYDVKLEIIKTKNSKIKSTAGKTTRYTLFYTVKIKLISADTEKTFNKSFTKDRDYAVASIHSDTIRNEKNATKIIIQQLSDQITNYINISLKNK